LTDDVTNGTNRHRPLSTATIVYQAASFSVAYQLGIIVHYITWTTAFADVFSFLRFFMLFWFHFCF